MSEMKHTPGPWRDNPDGKHHQLVGDGMWFAKLRWTVTGPRNAADARLIAAAPDMLAALKEANAFILAPAEDLKEGVLSRIRAAIAKAS